MWSAVRGPPGVMTRSILLGAIACLLTRGKYCVQNLKVPLTLSSRIPCDTLRADRGNFVLGRESSRRTLGAPWPGVRATFFDACLARSMEGRLCYLRVDSVSSAGLTPRVRAMRILEGSTPIIGRSPVTAREASLLGDICDELLLTDVPGAALLFSCIRFDPQHIVVFSL